MCILMIELHDPVQLDSKCHTAASDRQIMLRNCSYKLDNVELILRECS